MAKRKYSSPFPEPTDNNNPFAWRNLIETVEPYFPDEADPWVLARRHKIPPWEAVERFKGFCHAAKPTRH
jgi:hypothetical protein